MFDSAVEEPRSDAVVDQPAHEGRTGGRAGEPGGGAKLRVVKAGIALEIAGVKRGDARKQTEFGGGKRRRVERGGIDQHGCGELRIGADCGRPLAHRDRRTRHEMVAPACRSRHCLGKRDEAACNMVDRHEIECCPGARRQMADATFCDQLEQRIDRIEAADRAGAAVAHDDAGPGDDMAWAAAETSASAAALLAS